MHDMSTGWCVFVVECANVHFQGSPRPLSLLPQSSASLAFALFARSQVQRENADRHSSHNTDVKREHYEGVVIAPDVLCKLGGFTARDGANLRPHSLSHLRMESLSM